MTRKQKIEISTLENDLKNVLAGDKSHMDYLLTLLAEMNSKSRSQVIVTSYPASNAESSFGCLE